MTMLPKSAQSKQHAVCRVAPALVLECGTLRGSIGELPNWALDWFAQWAAHPDKTVPPLAEGDITKLTAVASCDELELRQEFRDAKTVLVASFASECFRRLPSVQDFVAEMLPRVRRCYTGVQKLVRGAPKWKPEAFLRMAMLVPALTTMQQSVHQLASHDIAWQHSRIAAGRPVDTATASTLLQELYTILYQRYTSHTRPSHSKDDTRGKNRQERSELSDEVSYSNPVHEMRGNRSNASVPLMIPQLAFDNETVSQASKSQQSGGRTPRARRGNETIKSVGKSESCMVTNLRASEWKITATNFDDEGATQAAAATTFDGETAAPAGLDRIRGGSSRRMTPRKSGAEMTSPRSASGNSP